MGSSRREAFHGAELPLELEDRRLERPDGRVVAWAEAGPKDGLPMLLFPGSPTSRYAIRSDRSWYARRRVRAIVTERPGLGASTRLPGHGFVEPADDIAAILDTRGIRGAVAWGGSAGSPYLLSFAQRHPDRLLAATIVGGTAPVLPEEVDALIPMNAAIGRAIGDGKASSLRAEVAARREAILADPLAAFRGIMETAPERDRAVMTDPRWQAELAFIVAESLRQGPDGWLDELVAGHRSWDEIDPARITADITWWHAPDDRNVSYAAASRLVDRLPSARLRDLGSGHLEAYHRSEEILDELLGRAA